MPERLMIVDRSGRGHCLAWSVAETSDAEVHYVPGCDGLGDARIRTAQHLSVQEPCGLVDYARQHKIDLVVVANAVALVGGAVDAFRAAGFPTIGPDRLAARLEGSKTYAKGVFERYGIPTPEHRAFASADAAAEFVVKNPDFRVVKADGLCGGNGSVVCNSEVEALAAIDLLMRARFFGTAGDRIVIERRIAGQELSFFAFLDAEGWRTLPMAADYPRADDWNRGPISGGMGAISHHPLDTPDLVRKVEERILAPLHRLIATEGLSYTGFIYLGIMVCDGDPYLLETNVRMGEPEAEVILPRVRSNLAELMGAMLRGRVAGCPLTLSDEYLCDVVATQGPVRGVAAENADILPGWPFGEVGTGHAVRGLEGADREKCYLFVGEARRRADGALVSDGGRVVHVVGRGSSRDEARRNAYQQIGQIWFDGMRYRHDLGLVMPWESLLAERGS